MMTAMVGGYAVKAYKGLKDKDFTYRCPNSTCNGELILVCSDRYLAGQAHGVRTVHFRHKHKCGCKYCFGEGAWHREWKSHFDRLEVRYPDFENGELNIADAVVGENFVLEFQHYHIALAEAEDRENAYKPNGGMLWILDVNHHNPLSRLRKAGAGVFEPCTVSIEPDHFEIANPAALFPEEWTTRTVCVVFDYGEGYPLLRLYPGRTKGGKAVVQKIEKARLIDELKRDPIPFAKDAGALFKPLPLEELRKVAEAFKMLKAYKAAHRPLVRRTSGMLMPTNKPYIYRDTNGRLFSDYFGQMYPYSHKFAAAIKRSQQKQAQYSHHSKWRKRY